MSAKKILIILLPILLQALAVWSGNIRLADTLDVDNGPVKLRSLPIPLLVDPAGDNRTGDLFKGGMDDGFATSCLTPVVTEYGPQLFECVQDSIVLWIKAVGTDREYRWQKYVANDFRDVDIADGRITGYNTDRMVIRNINKAKDDGVYRCLVSNGCGDTPSDTFRIVMNSAPYFLATLGTSVTWECVGPAGRNLAVAASCLNEKMLIYTWSKRDTLTGIVTLFDPEKNNKSALTIIPRSREDEGEYIVEVSNECGTIRDSVFMPVYMPVSVEEVNIKDRKIIACAGESADFQVKVAGGGVYTYVLKKVKVTNSYPLVYQVLSVVDTGKSQVTIDGLKASRDAGWYLWEVTNNCGKDTSEVFELIVHERPVFKKESPDTLACEGSKLILSCEAEGIGVEYYWYHNGEPTDTTGNTYKINEIKGENTGIYTCYAHNICSFHPQSRPIKVDMDPLPQILRQPFLLKPVCVGDSVVEISVRFASAQVDSLRWRYNDHFLYDDGVKIDGSTDSKLSIYRISMEEVGHYYVQAYNKCGSILSESAMLQINEPATIIKGLGGYDMLLCSGVDQQLSVKAKGALPIHYRWLCNERVIAESESNFVDIKSGDINEQAEYCVQVENMCGGESHCSHLRIAKIKTFDLKGGGAYCEGHTATGAFNMVKSDTNITYSLYREPGDRLEEFRGTGDTIKFEGKSSGTYYITGLDSNGCVQRMKNPVTIELKPSPAGGRLLMIDEYCMGSNGANLLMTDWEKDIQYKLYRKYAGDWDWYKNLMFIGGNDRMGSPAPGELKIWDGMDEGRYKIVAMNLFNGCSTEMVLPDSVQLRPAPRRYSLSALNGDYVNCSLEAELTQLRADGYESGSSYTLLKDEAPFGQVLKYSPIQWGHIDQGDYKLSVKNQWGCVTVSRPVKILNIASPAQVKIGGSGAICDGDTDRYKELTILGSESGVIYKIYKDFPETYVDKIIGTGNDVSIIIPAIKATYVVDAYDALGKCKVRLEDRFQVGASAFQAVTNPSEIFLDRGGRAHLHLDVKGSYAQPIVIEWKPKNMIEWGLVSSPTTQFHKQYYRPFCPCGCPSEGDLRHENVHGPNCELNPTKCPYIYHDWDPAEHGCVYQGTERIEWRGSMAKWYDLYFCKKQIIDDNQVGNEDQELPNPFRDPLTVPIYKDITYEVTTTDALGCSKTDQVKVKVTGKKLDAEIIFSEGHKHYYVPFCPCGCSDRSGYRHPKHGPGCNDSNCWYFYHNHKHEECTFQKTEKIFYNGSWRNYYDFYYCCTGTRAADTIVYRNEELFFCSSVDGGDYNYKYNWTYINADGNVTVFPAATDKVQFNVLESGYLYLDVVSMGQHKKDSIWIEVQRKPLEAQIRDTSYTIRLDSVSLCVGEEIEFGGWATGGDGPHNYRWFDEDHYDLSAVNSLYYKPEKSGYVWFVVTSDGIEVRDSVYVRLSPSPKKVKVVDPGLRCVQIGQEEFIKIPVSQKGVNYVLEHRPNNYANKEYGLRYNNATGGPVVFQILNPVLDAGMFKVRVDTIIGDKICSTYLDSIEFVAPPSDAQLVDSAYCEGTQGLKVRLKSVADSMRYLMCSSIGTVLDTVKKPETEFRKIFQAATYIFRTERIGDLGACKADRILHITRTAKPDISLAVEANAHGQVCEGSEILITVKNTEKDARYDLVDPDGVFVDVLTGDGRDQSFTAFPRPAGIYMIQATKKGCSAYLDNTIRVNKLPTNVEIDDIHYCFASPQKPGQITVPIELTGLQTNVAYYLKQKNVYLDTLEGPGTKSYKRPRSEGEYQILAKDKATQCVSPVSTFKIVADEGPYPFAIEGGCGAQQEVKIPGSQKRVTYSLWRDNAVVAQKAGTGAPLSFGMQRISGVYKISGTNDTTACETFMKGTVDIYELDTCDLKVVGSICNVGGDGSVELHYPCSRTGWSYFIQTVRAGVTVRSEILPGTGGELWWNLIDNKALKEGSYELWAANKCDTIKVKTVEVLRRTGPTGKIMPIVSACRDQNVEVMITGGDPELKYTLFGDVSSYQNKLYETMGSADNFSMGSYANYKTYRLAAAYPDGSCYKVFTLATVKISETPNPIDIVGEDICKTLGSSGAEEGAVALCLPRKEDKVNYYLLDGSRDKKVDSILITDSRICFELQKDTGCYYVWAKHAVTQCQDTMNGTYCLSSIPQPYAICVDSVIMGLTEIDMCIDQSCGILLLGSAKGVQYQLYLNGTTPVGKPKIGTGAMLSFDGIKLAGVYTVKGFNGCGERLMNLSVTVRVGDYPDMRISNPYYYCPDQPGAIIEVFDTERGSKFNLYRLERDWTRTLLESKESVTTGSTLTFAEQGRENIDYLLTVKTRYGCLVEKTFTVKRDTLPKDNFILSSTNNATTICEASCTELTLSGSEKEVEYYLYNVNKGEQAFLIGEGEPLNFGKMCEAGVYYVEAYRSYHPRCSARIPSEVTLHTLDTIRELKITVNREFYCNGDPDMASLFVPGSQGGIEYQVYKNGRPTGDKIRPNANGTTLKFIRMEGGTCENPNVYTVKASNASCSKFMLNEVRVVAENALNVGEMKFTPERKMICCEGDEVSFKMMANGCNLKYTWWMGITQQASVKSYLTLQNVKAAQAGIYTGKVENSCGRVDVGKVELSITPRPKIVQPMPDVVFCEGHSAYVYSMMDNVHTGNYKWYRTDDGLDTIFSREPYLEFAKITKADVGEYVCEGSSECYTVKDTFMLAVDVNTDSLHIAKLTDTLCVGSPFAAQINTLAPYDKLTWNFNGVSTGVKGYVYPIRKIAMKDDGIYSVTMDNACGLRDIVVKQLIVDDSIKVLDITPSSRSCAGVPMDLYIKTRPTMRVDYNWYEGADWLGRGEKISTVVGLNEVSRTYRVYYSNQCGRKSSDVNISINGQLTMDSPPAEILLCADPNADTTLCVKVHGMNVSGYQWLWQKKGSYTVDSLGTMPCETIKRLTSHTGFYWCSVKTECHPVSSPATWLKIDTVPVISDLPAIDTLCIGGTYKLQATAVGGGGMIYDWNIKYKDGHEELLFQDEGKDFTSTSVFLLGPVTERFDSAWIWCVSRNECGEDSTKMFLRVDKARELIITPYPDTTICEHSYAQIRVELKNGAYPWAYSYRDTTTGMETFRNITTGMVDILDIERAGVYDVLFLRDGKSCNYADGNLRFKVNTIPAPVASIAVVGPDTLCLGDKARVRVEIKYPSRKVGQPIPDGPWEVKFIRKDGSEAIEMGVTNPYIIYKKHPGDTVVVDTLKPFGIQTSMTYYIGSVKDAGDATGISCAGQPEDSARFVLRSRDTLRFDFRSERDTLGYCNSVLLDTLLNPNMDGDFYIDGIKSQLGIFNSPPLEPGRHIIKYHTYGRCPVSNDSVRLWVMPKPKLMVTPRDTALCPGSAANITLSATGVGPFKLKYELRNIKRDGSVNPAPVTSGDVPTPKTINVANSVLDDSVRIITPIYLRDRFDCWADKTDTIQAVVEMRKYPEFEVYGMHKNFDDGKWADWRDSYIIPNGDSVNFRIELQYGGKPWNYSVVKMGDSPLTVGPVSGNDTTSYKKAEGQYIFTVVDRYGCSKPGKTEVRNIFYKEPGYVRIKMLLEGAYNESSSGKLMSAGLQRHNILPKRGLASWPVTDTDSIVDWVVVEVREEMDKACVASDTFLLRNDGQVIDRNGSDTLGLQNTTKLWGSENQYIVVKHRNHVSIMTKDKILIVDEASKASVKTIDFTLESTLYCPAGSTLDAHAWKAGSGLWGLAAGYDLGTTNGLIPNNQLVSVSNPNAAKFATIKEVQATYRGYYWRDVTLDGIVQWPEDIIPGDNIFSVTNKNLYKSRDAWILHKNRNKYSAVPYVN